MLVCPRRYTRRMPPVFVEMGVRALQPFAALTQQASPSGTPNSTPVAVHSGARQRLALPAAPPAIRLRHVAAKPEVGQRDHRLVAVVALVADDLGHTTIRRQHRFDLLGRRHRRLDHRRRVARVGVLDGHADDRARLQVHRVLRLVGQVGAAVLHLRDLRVRVLRVGPVVVGTLLRPFPVEPGQLRPCRRRNAQRDGQSVQEGLVAFTGVPPDDTPHRCVRFQRRCIDPDRLALDESGVGQPLQHPRENRFVRLEVDPPPRARHRRVVRRGFVKRDVEERPQAQGIGGPPGNRPLGIEPLEVAREQHPEVSARRQARPTHAVGVELRALLLGEDVEAGLVD